MKKLFTIVCLLVSVMGRGQCNWAQINFDADTCYRPLLIIDTVNYHNNRWQIGKPNKTTFNAAVTLPNAIVTDTTNPYPVNDTSVFILKVPTYNPNCPFGPAPFFHLEFLYKLDLDTSALATVEISVDTGRHWANIKDTLPGYISWFGMPADFSDSSIGWQQFKLNYNGYLPTLDTILFRFTLISGNDTTSNDGWIIDNINLRYWCEGAVRGVQNPNLITLYPNPSHGNIYIHTDKPRKVATVTVHDIQGRQVYSSVTPPNGYLNLQLPDGVYTLKYSDEEEYCVKRVVIQN